jgi:lysophospholipase L1-like esterase
VDNAVEPTFQEYVGSTFNGNFEVGNAAVGNQYWGQFVPNQSAVAGSPNMLNLITSPAGTEPGNVKNGNNMAEVIRGGSAWNPAAMSSTPTDKLPRVGDIVGGKYWIWVSANADLNLVPTVRFAYQPGDVVLADSSGFPTTSLVKGKWNQVPLYPKANSPIPATATGAVILVSAPQGNATTNPLYAAKYYIDEIRVGKIPAGMFFAADTTLVSASGTPISAPGTGDTSLNVKAIVQNSQSSTAVNATLVLRLYEGATLKSTTTKALTVAAKGSTGISNTETTMTASLAGIDLTKLNARLHLYDAAQQAELATPFSLVQKTKLISPNDSAIKYRGRWAVSGGATESNWVRPYFKTAFTGANIRINLTQSTNLSVILDGVESSYIGAQGSFVLGANLPAGTHSLRVATLDWADRLFFTGLSVDDVGALSTPAMRPKHIEFIGDSITAWKNGYSWQVPEQLNVESSRIAWPGIALVDGFGYYRSTPPLYGMASAFLKAGMPEYGSAGDWSFPAAPFIPDVVVVNLGTNDAAQITGMPTYLTNFNTTYAAFLRTVRSKYSQAHIFVLKPFSIPYLNVNVAIQNAAQTVINEGDAKVHYVETSSWGVQIGPDGVHPTDAGHVTITNKLIPLVSPYLQ